MPQLYDSFFLTIPGSLVECDSFLTFNSLEKNQEDLNWGETYTVTGKHRAGRTGTGALRVNIATDFAISWQKTHSHGDPSATITPPAPVGTDPCEMDGHDITVTGDMPATPSPVPTTNTSWTATVSMAAAG